MNVHARSVRVSVTVPCTAARSASFPTPPPTAFTPDGALSPGGPVVHVINQPFWCLLSSWRQLLMPLSQRSKPGRQLSEQCNTTSLRCVVTPLATLGTHTHHWQRSKANHLDTCTIQVPKHRHVAPHIEYTRAATPSNAPWGGILHLTTC